MVSNTGPLDGKFSTLTTRPSSVHTFSKRGMVKDDETTGVTEYIIPIPWNALRPSKALELWSALSATWCMKYVGLAELDSDTPEILVPWCPAAQCSYFRTSMYET